MSLYAIGIDPGLTGALALLGPRGLEAVLDMPTMQRGAGKAAVKNQVNAAALSTLLAEWCNGHDKVEMLVVLERQAFMFAPGRKRAGPTAVFSLGHTAGIIEGVVAARGLRHELVTPLTWKKALGIPGGEKNKGMARALAQRLYPEAPLAREKDHNRAEAILLAHWGYGRNA